MLPRRELGASVRCRPGGEPVADPGGGPRAEGALPDQPARGCGASASPDPGEPHGVLEERGGGGSGPLCGRAVRKGFGEEGGARARRDHPRGARGTVAQGAGAAACAGGAVVVVGAGATVSAA